MAGIRIKSLQSASPLVEQNFDDMLFVVDMTDPDTTLCLSGRELRRAVGLKTHTHTLDDINGLIGELEKKLNTAGGTISGDLRVLGQARIKSLEIDEYLSTPELRYNRITATGNELWATDAGIVDEVWMDEDGVFLVTLKRQDADEPIVNFQFKDILRGIFKSEGGGFSIAYFEVTGIVDETRFDCIALNGIAPQRFMTLVRQGNKTNAQRQGSVYIDGLNKYLRVMDKVNSSDISQNNIKVQLGDLSNINHPVFGQLEGYGALLENAFISGRLVQHNPATGEDFVIGAVAVEGEQTFHYDSDNIPDKESITLKATEQGISSQPNERQWQYKSGTEWITIENENDLCFTLRHDSDIWQNKSSLTLRYIVQDTYFDIITITKLYDGEDAYRVEISSSSGDNFINGDITSTLTARVYKGSREITTSIPPAHFSWTRTSQNSVGDNVWNQLHEGIGNTLTIGDEDIFRKAVFECVVVLE